MPGKKYVPRPVSGLFTPGHVERDNNRLAGQIDKVAKVDPGHPLRKAFFGVLDATQSSETIFMHLAGEQEAQIASKAPAPADTAMLKDLAHWKELHGSAWRKGTIKLALLAMMCRDVDRGRTLEEIHDDAQKHLALQAQAYDDMDTPLACLPRPFVGSPEFGEIETFVTEKAVELQNYPAKPN